MDVQVALVLVCQRVVYRHVRCNPAVLALPLSNLPGAHLIADALALQLRSGCPAAPAAHVLLVWHIARLLALLVFGAAVASHAILDHDVEAPRFAVGGAGRALPLLAAGQGVVSAHLALALGCAHVPTGAVVRHALDAPPLAMGRALAKAVAAALGVLAPALGALAAPGALALAANGPLLHLGSHGASHGACSLEPLAEERAAA
mmetsp:Transcript_63224/g.142849  ORF Transcript_63224/g.142849 Transcript_63224/m.142849 type:complete len:204 (-) Transcript_63224:6-617(-)